VRRLLLRFAVVLLLPLCAGGYLAFAAPDGPRSLRQFEPQRLASLELEMWRAYYSRENVRLFRLLVVMLREQYNYPWATAVREGVHLARAAATFATARADYEVVLPDLMAAYTIARDWTGAGFDPAAVAKAELAWWVARRIPGQNSPEQIGELIAVEYALLYESTPAAMRRSAQLRARAAALRDAQAEALRDAQAERHEGPPEGGPHGPRDAQASAPDWNEISKLLTESYIELRNAVGQRS